MMSNYPSKGDGKENKEALSMATEAWSRKRRHQTTQTDPIDLNMGTSRADLKRAARERQMERQFAWAFIITVTLTTLYLIWRLPWGHQILSRWH